MSTILRRTGKALIYSAYAFSFLHLTGEHVGSIIYCNGDSMLPTIRSGDCIWSTRCNSPETLREGDVVCLVDPRNPDESVMKRIYCINSNDRRSGPLLIEVLGDNRESSIDSREYGPVPLALVRYKALYRIYPLNRRGWIT